MERRTIPELIARYKLHPTLRDVYVEGPFDKHLLQWFLQESGYDDVTIYVIDTVDVAAPSDGAYGEDGTRGRVLSLIRVLERELQQDLWCALGIVDSDFDFALGIKRPERLLLVMITRAWRCTRSPPAVWQSSCS